MKNFLSLMLIVQILIVFPFYSSMGQIGKRFPSERKVVKDPVTGIDLVFLTSVPDGDRKIYQTHNQWTSDEKWVVFESNRFNKEAMF